LLYERKSEFVTPAPKYENVRKHLLNPFKFVEDLRRERETGLKTIFLFKDFPLTHVKIKIGSSMFTNLHTHVAMNSLDEYLLLSFTKPVILNCINQDLNGFVNKKFDI